jgi:hypothetical protein
MIRNLCIILFVIINISAVEDQYTLLKSIPFAGVTFFTTDKLGNTYVIVENQLLLFDAEGKPVANYSQNKLGELRLVDASNPLKVVLFYPDFAQLIVLNSKLAEQSVINLRNAGIVQPMTAANSENGGYWFFDRDDEQLKKIDNNLQIVYRSDNLSQTLGYAMQPKQIVEENGHIYVNDPENGIHVFDRFGTYYKTLPFTHIGNFQLIENSLLFVEGSRLYKYDSKTVAQKEILLPPHDSLISARIEQNKLYLLTTTSLNFYSF